MRHFVNFGASTSSASSSGKPATSILKEHLMRVAPIVVHSNIQVSPPVIDLVTPAHDVEMNMGEILEEITDLVPFTEEPMELDLDDLLIMIDEQEAAAAAAAPTSASIAASTPDPAPQEQKQLAALTDKESHEKEEEETHAFIELPGEEWDEAGVELEAQEEEIEKNEWDAAGKSLEAALEVSIPGPSRRNIEFPIPGPSRRIIESPRAGPSRRATESPIAGPSNESPAAQRDVEGNDEDEEELTNLIQQINLDISRQEEVIAGEEEILQQHLKKIENQNEKLQKMKNARLEVQRLLIEHKRLKALARKNKNKIRGVRDKMPKM